jgi:mercuric ion transport protein
VSKTALAGAGGVVAALLGSLCCIGPLLFVALGVGAGLASTFEPLRPVFGVIMVASLGLGLFSVYGRRPARTARQAEVASADATCAVRRRGRDVALLWIAVVVALVLWAFPTWSTLFL